MIKSDDTIVYRLDRTAFWAGKIEDQSERDAAYWQEKTADERLAAAHYLNSIAYCFDPTNPPRMDKTKFSISKRKKSKTTQPSHEI